MKINLAVSILLIYLFPLSAWAQLQELKELPHALSQSATQATRVSHKLSSEAVERILETRMPRSYELAKKAQENHWLASYRYPDEKPRDSFSVPLSGNYSELYPDVPFLKTQEQISAYLVSQVNREVAKTMAYREAYWKKFEAYLPRIKETMLHFTHEPQEDMKWLAGQISEHTRYLFLGERHEVPEVQENITRLMQEIRRTQPQRQIFLFTEFLEAGPQWTPGQEITHPEYLSVWQAAYKEGITVLGLEHDIDLSPTWRDIWKTREGVRLRNRHWLATIEQYRHDYPDALFIVYTGAGHVMYHEPYSLGRFFAGPQTYVATFYPEKGRDQNKRITYNTSFFDILTAQAHLATERIISFDDKEISQLVGFDAQFRLPVKLWPEYNVLEEWKIHEEE